MVTKNLNYNLQMKLYRFLIGESIMMIYKYMRATMVRYGLI